MQESSNVAEFYEGRSVFITGATGFMGKVLVEKLLRSCPGIENVFVLMRPSRGKNVNCRLNDLIENQIFNRLKAENPTALRKLVALEGDVTLPNGFGLSANDLQVLIDKVSVVFNLAATVRFDEDLKTAVEMNVNGPRQLMAICHRMKRLEAFVHVSTAYNNLDREVIDEIIYPGEVDPIKLVDFINSLDSESSMKLSKIFLGKCPNTYTYTKALAEQILEKERGGIPLAIIRPSIVAASLQEPCPGWIDNTNGATGMLAAAGKGFISIYKQKANDYVIDLIPVDFAINLMIVIAWHIANQKLDRSTIPVYNCSSSNHNPITFGQLKSHTIDTWKQFPPKEMMWYPSAEFTCHDWYYQLNVLLGHLVPAYCVDMISRLKGKRAKWVRLYEKAFTAMSSLDYFCSHQWLFVSKKPYQLWSQLSPRDSELFYFDVKQINWPDYVQSYILGVRKFIFKDDPDTLPMARKNLSMFYLSRMLVRLFFFVISLLVLASLPTFSSSHHYDSL